MTKKFLAVSLALCLVLIASAAFAWHRRPMPNQEYHYGYGQEGMMYQITPFDRQHRRDFGYRDSRVRFTPDMPKEIRSMITEAAKLRIDLDEALHSNPMDKAKAFEIHDKIMKLEQDIERWKFVQRVDRIEKFRKLREERKNQNRSTESDSPKTEQTSK